MMQQYWTDSQAEELRTQHIAHNSADSHTPDTIGDPIAELLGLLVHLLL